MSLLKFSEVTKYYGDFLANDSISFDINEGSIHAIIGENGAGKSTLMNMLSGVIEPTSGSIILNNKDIHFKNPNDATAAGIGMVQQEFMLFDELSVVENIVMGYEDVKTNRLLDLNKSKKKIEKLCKEYNFDIPLEEKIRNLPLAVQQQVEIVKVLYKEADIIILDEPTAILTPQGIEGLFKAMDNLIKQGKTILFITHKLKEVLEVSDRITVLKDGKHVNTFDNKEVTEKDLANAMVGREVFLEIERNKASTNIEVLNVNKVSALDARGVKKLKDVSFKVNEGEVVGVVGVANNGQTELVGAISGMKSYTSGEIIFKGKKLSPQSPRKNREEGIGYVPQDRIGVGSSQISTLTENAIIGKHLNSFKGKFGTLDWKEAVEYSEYILDGYSVKYNRLSDNIGSLSGGNMQKLIVGREFTQQNDLLIIEDPVRGIDIGSIEFIWNEIANQVENAKVSVLLVTYDLNEAMTLSDRIVVMYDGEIVKTFERDEFDEYEIGFYMLGGKNNDNQKIY